MDFLSAAYQVLADAGEPLRYEEIARRAQQLGLLTTTGKTPEATMGSRLYTDVKKEDSRFEQVAQATFVLRRRTPVDDIGRRVQKLNEATCKTIRKRLLEMPADRFEALIGELLVQIGFDETSVQVTSYSNDGGIDVRGVLNAGDVTEVTAAVQVKRWQRNVQARTVRDVRGSLTTHEQGIIITTSGYSRGALEEANAVGKAPISLVDGDALIKLMIKHNVGVTKQGHEVLSLDSEWWTQISGVEDREVSLPEGGEGSGESADSAVEVSFPLTLRALNDPTKTALLLDRAGRTRFAETLYRSPSGAGKDASGWKSCNGWRYWQYQDPDTQEWLFIDALRASSI